MHVNHKDIDYEKRYSTQLHNFPQKHVHTLHSYALIFDDNRISRDMLLDLNRVSTGVLIMVTMKLLYCGYH